MDRAAVFAAVWTVFLTAQVRGGEAVTGRTAAGYIASGAFRDLASAEKPGKVGLPLLVAGGSSPFNLFDVHLKK